MTAVGAYPPPLGGWPKTPPPADRWDTPPPLTGPDDPRHGREIGYMAGCRADCCLVTRRRAKKAARVRRERFGPAYVPGALAEEIAIRWAQYGVGPTPVALAAGVAEDSLMRALNHGTRISRGSLVALRRVTWDDLPDTVLVYAELTRARVRSLQAAGFPLSYIIDQAPALPRGGRWRKTPRLSLGIARAVLAVYEAAPLAGPSSYVAARARSAGYLHPLAWDDPGTPAAPHGWRWEPARTDRERAYDRLDMSVVWRRLNGDRAVPASRRERIEIVRIARDEYGWTERHIRDVTGIGQAWDRRRYPAVDAPAQDREDDEGAA